MFGVSAFVSFLNHNQLQSAFRLPTSLVYNTHGLTIIETLNIHLFF